jgi:hypothetical protein
MTVAALLEQLEQEDDLFTVASWCRRHGFNYRTVMRWRNGESFPSRAARRGIEAAHGVTVVPANAPIGEQVRALRAEVADLQHQLERLNNRLARPDDVSENPGPRHEGVAR